MTYRPLPETSPGKLLQGGPSLRAIFISYRREDSEGEAGRLFDDLTDAFEEQNVFMDVDAISPGLDFRKAIQESIRQCSVLLSMIGPGWATACAADGSQRLANPTDFVRVEIAEALRRDIPVIPVLVRGARMPAIEQLPPDLAELAFRNAIELGHARWKSDVQVLIRALRPFVETAVARHPAEADAPGMPQPHGAPNPNPPPSPTQAPGPAQPESAIDAAELQRLTRDLAVYIGPIAEVVVRRAAKRFASLPELSSRVAQEIASDVDRARFLAGADR